MTEWSIDQIMTEWSIDQIMTEWSIFPTCFSDGFDKTQEEWYPSFFRSKIIFNGYKKNLR